MITLDGAAGEGGGQILRTALTLSLATGQPFRIERIRAGRARPGLLRQHLTAVAAAAAIGGARVRGDVLGSPSLYFDPGTVRAGTYRFDIGSAGSTTLVVQTVLLPLVLAAGTSVVEVVGGTHNTGAPPFEFLADVFLPALARGGAQVGATLRKPGYFPAGGGCIEIAIEGIARLAPFDLLTRGVLRRRRATARVARLAASIARRELAVVRERLGFGGDELRVEEIADSDGPGNVLLLDAAFEHGREIIAGFGERGVSAEAVASGAVDEFEAFLSADVPVGRHLADQLLLPLALAGSGRFVTLAPTPHAVTNAEVIGRFLPVSIAFQDLGGGRCEVVVRSAMHPSGE